MTLADCVKIKELSEYLGHHDPGFTLQMYTHMVRSSYGRARQAVDRRLEQLAAADGAAEQGRNVLRTGLFELPRTSCPAIVG
ncbi:hypothetical protein E0H50_18480 [Kribbella sindirgiensis]|uniref:Integrase n=1 Tax=Kribbella sindirgiensis TaxID=1124744 RepID=A0A4V2M3M3_9ACTN|nr:hypothetical protein E0H50_18480 [Kribbella sindirgiensis]